MNLFDLPYKFQFNFQDPASPIMEGIANLHHGLLFCIIFVMGLVLYLFFALLYHFNYRWNYPTLASVRDLQKNYLILNRLNHSTILELLWTLIPSFALLIIAVPSFSLLYAMDEVFDPQVTLKAIGHQWYWSYEIGDYDHPLQYDSYMVSENDLQLGDPRLYKTDTFTVLPSSTSIRVLVTSSDVLHSFSVPSLGIKADAVPGRLNQLSFFIKRNGSFYGQCSELCGVNHGFMPISIKAVPVEAFKHYLVDNQVHNSTSGFSSQLLQKSIPSLLEEHCRKDLCERCQIRMRIKMHFHPLRRDNPIDYVRHVHSDNALKLYKKSFQTWPKWIPDEGKLWQEIFEEKKTSADAEYKFPRKSVFFPVAFFIGSALLCSLSY